MDAQDERDIEEVLGYRWEAPLNESAIAEITEMFPDLACEI